MCSGELSHGWGVSSAPTPLAISHRRRYRQFETRSSVQTSFDAPSRSARSTTRRRCRVGPPVIMAGWPPREGEIGHQAHHSAARSPRPPSHDRTPTGRRLTTISLHEASGLMPARRPRSTLSSAPTLASASSPTGQSRSDCPFRRNAATRSAACRWPPLVQRSTAPAACSAGLEPLLSKRADYRSATEGASAQALARLRSSTISTTLGQPARGPARDSWKSSLTTARPRSPPTTAFQARLLAGGSSVSKRRACCHSAAPASGPIAALISTPFRLRVCAV